MGLMRVGCNGGKAKVVAMEAFDVLLSFTNGVNVDQVTRDVYFTLSSTTYSRARYERTTPSGDSIDRIMKYDSHTNEVTVFQCNATYPNDITIRDYRTHFVVASIEPCNMLKLWIRGPKTGMSKLFVCQLVGISRQYLAR
ncbi:hypothetical protein PR202_gb11658 [Eleusine coracana subsp. coracana]|uniref:Strictosidine synthase conserved region domain-containing protein n=1 Tax=Eleusine coracana subsp. coracana TaxID=191504 RepID=A0AAV5EMA9_ELECO|nr:hypothetical protein PR202_gb11658 [Eleusine coracana subsp. coracana]